MDGGGCFDSRNAIIRGCMSSNLLHGRKWTRIENGQFAGGVGGRFHEGGGCDWGRGVWGCYGGGRRVSCGRNTGILAEKLGGRAFCILDGFYYLQCCGGIA